MYISHFVYLFIYQWTLGCFHLLANVNNTAMNVDIQIPIQVFAFIHFFWVYTQKWNCWIIWSFDPVSLVAQVVKNLPAIQETQVRSLGQEDPLEKEMATHSSILAWKIPWVEEPGGLQSMGSQRVEHD